MQTLKEKRKFSLLERLKSTNNAWRGVLLFIKTTHNAWVHLVFAILAVYLGFLLDISSTEWILLVLIIGIVLVAEAFNTAIEIDMDLTSPNYHPYAKDTKDVAAGAVLISVIMAGIVGLIIFLPKVVLIL